ncbi:inositol monophosphatase family protein [Nakamurella deserti]|uniref:inositol monophosphatase family protein n=1 Tax=Nakamurella deserti TaxID=2164074 RepID=UPI000DBE4A92|nr:inositol monophosphatase family protein [Nakamurella deserti]
MSAADPRPVHADDLALALLLADAADAISMDRFQAADLRVDSKPDLTPVSDADTAVERALRAMITAERPDDVVVGEEYGGALSDTTGRRWVVDPIDGTKNYVRGVPVWATLIALLDDTGAIVVGVVSAPALARRWWATVGGGAFTAFREGTPRRCRVSAVADPADASLAISDLAEWEAHDRLEQLLGLSRATWRLRGYGDFYPYMLVAEGAVDIAAEPELNVWDMAALVPIVSEAGGTMTGIDGRTPATDAGNALATNGLLHAAVSAALAP